MIDLDELERLVRAAQAPKPTGDDEYDAILSFARISAEEELSAALRKAAPELIAMARLGKIAIRYIDRANDVADCDPADRILSEWAAEVNAVLAAMQEQKT